MLPTGNRNLCIEIRKLSPIFITVEHSNPTFSNLHLCKSHKNIDATGHTIIYKTQTDRRCKNYIPPFGSIIIQHLNLKAVFGFLSIGFKHKCFRNYGFDERTPHNRKMGTISNFGGIPRGVQSIRENTTKLTKKKYHLKTCHYI